MKIDVGILMHATVWWQCVGLLRKGRESERKRKHTATHCNTLQHDQRATKHCNTVWIPRTEHPRTEHPFTNVCNSMAATLWDYSVALVGGKETIYTPLRKRVENVVSAAIWTGSAVTVLGFSLSLSRALSLSLFLSLSAPLGLLLS